MGKRYMYMCVNIKTQTTNHRAQQVGGMKDKAWVYGFKKTGPEKLLFGNIYNQISVNTKIYLYGKCH